MNPQKHPAPSLPAGLADGLQAALGGALRIDGWRPLAGGSIATALAIDTDRGRLFVKLGAADHPFEAEADALRAIGRTGTLRAPQPLAHATAGRRGFLALEWIELAHSAGDAGWRAAGAQLAALHGCVGEHHGWHRDNAIGASAQSNAPAATWAEFWRERRLRPQFALARRHDLRALVPMEDRACAASDRLLAAHEPPPSLLHGDLWRGNLAFDADGAPVVFDPACYFGDAETDLAMTRLFGGFAPAFYAAYDAARPPVDGRRERDALYRLYHVLNHANLFGGGYVGEAIALIERL